jgi:HBS1 N-terminus
LHAHARLSPPSTFHILHSSLNFKYLRSPPLNASTRPLVAFARSALPHFLTMSNRRVKSLALDDDDFDEDYYEEDYDDTQTQELTDDDKEQMRVGTIKVREALGSSLSVSDNDIQEALWNYYWDVGKSVSYLKSKSPSDLMKPPDFAKISISQQHPPLRNRLLQRRVSTVHFPFSTSSFLQCNLQGPSIPSAVQDMVLMSLKTHYPFHAPLIAQIQDTFSMIAPGSRFLRIVKLSFLSTPSILGHDC